jgi:hypothetical protein
LMPRALIACEIQRGNEAATALRTTVFAANADAENLLKQQVGVCERAEELQKCKKKSSHEVYLDTGWRATAEHEVSDSL